MDDRDRKPEDSPINDHKVDGEADRPATTDSESQPPCEPEGIDGDSERRQTAPDAEPKEEPSGAQRSADRESKRSASLASKLFGFVSAVFSIVMILLCVIVFAQALMNPGANGVALGPIRFYSVLSGSMEPAISVGSMVVVLEAEEEDLVVGDVITIQKSEDDRVLVTHRIIGIDRAASLFTTQGDNVDTPDPNPTHYNNIHGRVIFTIPFLGTVTEAAAHPLGMLAIIIIFVMVIVLIEIVKNALKQRKNAGSS